MITALLTDDEQQRADVVFSILISLENNGAPDDWVDQLRVADIGSFSEQWLFAKRLGAKGCDIVRRNKIVEVWGTPHFLEHYEGLNQIPVKTKRFRIPYRYFELNQGNYAIIDCLETTAKIAYVQGFDKAMNICIEAMSNQQPGPNPLYGEMRAKSDERYYAELREIRAKK